MTLWQRLSRIRRPAPPRLFRSASPLSAVWGFDRGTPVDRYYIESFLEENRKDITGRTLEVADTEYIDRYGTGVTKADVLDIDASNKRATLIADLSAADQIPPSAFDCFILTQTLQLIYDQTEAIGNAYRLLRPGGVLLVTVPSVSRIDRDFGCDYWRFTTASCQRLFAEWFGAERTTIRSYGNLVTCVAFLQGMAYEELSRQELEENDPAFPLIIAVRGV
jgi:SAM-dependent methyltransferase